MKKHSGHGLLKLALAGAAVVAVASTPLLGSAAGLANTPFAIRAVNLKSDGKISAIKPFLKDGTGSGSTTPTPTPTGGATTAPPTTGPTAPPSTEPTRAPDSAPDLISMKIDTSLPGCTATANASSTGKFVFNVPTYNTSDATRTPLTANANINWGDGKTDTAKVGANSHIYTPGKYEIQIVGKLGGLTDTPVSSNSCISEVTHLGENTGLVTLEGFLNSAANVTAVSAPPTSLQNAKNMLFGASKFTGSEVNTWVLPNLVTANGMFDSASVFNGDLSSLNPKSLTDASAMFRRTPLFEGKGLSKWNTSSFTNIANIFSNAKVFNGDVSNWNVSKVTNFTSTFGPAPAFTGDLSRWNTGSATNFYSMFNGASKFDSDISNWDVSKGTLFGSMFSGASAFNQPIGKWTTTSVRDLSNTFANATSFNQDLSNWNTSKVTDLTNTFYGATAFNGNVANWNTGLVTSMAGTFAKTSAFTGPIGNWNLGSVTNTGGMFNNATAFNSDISNWNVSNVTNMANMFWGASSFNQPLSNWAAKTGKVTSMSYMFWQASSYSQNISSWNVSNVTIYSYFAGGSKLTKAQVPSKFQSTVS